MAMREVLMNFMVFNVGLSVSPPFNRFYEPHRRFRREPLFFPSIVLG